MKWEWDCNWSGARASKAEIHSEAMGLTFNTIMSCYWHCTGINIKNTSRQGQQRGLRMVYIYVPRKRLRFETELELD